jgi:hypothetical protein
MRRHFLRIRCRQCSQLGQSRRSDHAPITSGLSQWPDIGVRRWHAGGFHQRVGNRKIACARLARSSRRRPGDVRRRKRKSVPGSNRAASGSSLRARQLSNTRKSCRSCFWFVRPFARPGGIARRTMKARLWPQSFETHRVPRRSSGRGIEQAMTQWDWRDQLPALS